MIYMLRYISKAREASICATFFESQLKFPERKPLKNTNLPRISLRTERDSFKVDLLPLDFLPLVDGCQSEVS